MRLEEIAIGNNLTGVEPTLVLNVIAVRTIADGAVEVIYKTPDGTIRDRLLGRADEESIDIATVERPWSFDGDGEAFKLAFEAKRIDLANQAGISSCAGSAAMKWMQSVENLRAPGVDNF